MISFAITSMRLALSVKARQNFVLQLHLSLSLMTLTTPLMMMMMIPL